MAMSRLLRCLDLGRYLQEAFAAKVHYDCHERLARTAALF